MEGTVMAARKAPAQRPGEVDRAVKSIKAAVGRLVGHLGDDDPAVVQQAVIALGEIGPFIVGPLATALFSSSSPRHRMFIIAALKTYGPQAEAPVLRALAKAVKDDPDERVRAVAEDAMTAMLMAGMTRRRSSVPATGSR